MTNEVAKTIHRTSGVAAAIAAVLSPIPLADELVLLPVYGVLSRRIGRAHGLSIGQIPWRPIGRTALNGLTARGVLNLAVSFIPGVAAVANAASAVVLTEFLGRYIDDACSAPARAKPIGIKTILEMLRKRTASTPVPSEPVAASAMN